MQVIGKSRAFLEGTFSNTTFGYEIPLGLRSVWVCAGAQFQLEYDLNSDECLDSLVYWWLKIGRQEFPGIQESIDRLILNDLHLKPLRRHFSQQSTLELTPLQLLVLRHRPDLSAALADGAEGGISDFWKWWLYGGQFEYFDNVNWVVSQQADIVLEGLTQLTSEYDSARYNIVLDFKKLLLREADAATELLGTIHFQHFPQADTPLFATPLMSLIHRNRPDLQSLFDLDTDVGMVGFWDWWLVGGQQEYLGNPTWIESQKLLGLFAPLVEDVQCNSAFDKIRYKFLSEMISRAENDPQLRSLLECIHFSSTSERAGRALTPLMHFVYRNRPDLGTMFSAETEDGAKKVWTWWLADGPFVYFEDSRWAVREQSYRLLQDLGRDLTDSCDIRYSALLGITPMICEDDASGALLHTIHFRHFPRADLLPAATPLMHLIHRNRPDLQSLFDLDTDVGMVGFWDWWLVSGQQEYLGNTTWIESQKLLGLFAPLVEDVQCNSAFDKIRYKFLGEMISRAENDPQLRSLLECIHFSSTSERAGRALTPLMHFVYRNRPDLGTMFSAETEDGAKKAWAWWLADGPFVYFEDSRWAVREQSYRLLQDLGRDLMDSGDIRYSVLLGIKPVIREDDASFALLHTIHFRYFPRPDLSPAATPLMHLIHRNRPDLQSLFDLDTDVGMVGFWDWWLVSGQQEYLGNTTWIESQKLLGLFAPLVEDVQCNSAFDKIRYKFLGDMINRAKHDQLFHALLSRLQVSPTDNKGGPVLTPLMHLVYRNRPDLRTIFDITTREGVNEFHLWWLSDRQNDFALKTILDDSTSNNRGSELLLQQPSFLVSNVEAPVPTTADVTFPRISLIGYPKGEFGLGEDIRLLRTSLNAVGIKPDVIKASWKITARESIEEPSIDANAATFEGDVAIYVMPAFDTLTLLNKIGPRAFSAKRRIGFWQWELENFPESAKIAMDLVDEIWCHSDHSARAFSQATDKPVIKVPLPVFVPKIGAICRPKFGLESSDFIVFTSFDGASSIARKNPLGAILAFQEAFPRSRCENVKLIIKAMNLIDDSLWRECQRKAATDDRILIRNEVMDRMEYYELLQCCDVVLSLHRAEGFGRLMAEAMAIEIPVIASRYSGNLDFMTDNNSWLVPGPKVPLFAGDYPFFQGQSWLEPDISSAAEALKDCHGNAEKRRIKTMEARKSIAAYGLFECGKVYEELLGLR